MKYELYEELPFFIIAITALALWYLLRKLVGYVSWKQRVVSLLLGAFLIAGETATIYVFSMRNLSSDSIIHLLACLIECVIISFLIPLGTRIFNREDKGGSFQYIFFGTQLLVSACILVYFALAAFN